MRPTLVVAALLSSGCAALLHGGEPGYPDADLPRFAVAAPGMRQVYLDQDARGAMVGGSEGVMLEVGLTPDGAERHRFRMSLVAGGAPKVSIREERVYPDRIELVGPWNSPFVTLRTPLRPGTRWRYERGQPDLFGVREITGLADVCTPAGQFRQALIVEARWNVRSAREDRLVVYRSREWYAPGIGQVQLESWREDAPANVITTKLVKVWPGEGAPPIAFPPCP